MNGVTMISKAKYLIVGQTPPTGIFLATPSRVCFFPCKPPIVFRATKSTERSRQEKRRSAKDVMEAPRNACYEIQVRINSDIKRLGT